MQHHHAPQAQGAVARSDQAFPWYIGAAFGVALGGGFALGLLLPVATALEWGSGTRLRALVQVHGHLQVMGWAGLFITGMAFRLVSRFAGRPLRLPAATLPTLVLLLAGLLGRSVAQPWLAAPGMRALLTFSVASELVGAVLFAGVMAGTLAPVARTLAAAPLLLLGAAGMVAQAAFGAIWLTNLSDSLPVVPADRNAALLAIQFYAFMLPFVLGVSIRALPTFFASPAPSPRRTWAIAAVLAAGTVLDVGAPIVVHGATAVRLQQSGALLIAGAIAAAIRLTGVWRQPTRLRPVARGAALLVRTAYAWLALAAGGIVFIALPALTRGQPAPSSQEHAVRHILALGVITTLIVGMALLMLPWLGMRRLPRTEAHQEARLLWALLTAATALRALGALRGDDAGPAHDGPVALSGLLAIAALAFFALRVLRAARGARDQITLHERSEA